MGSRELFTQTERLIAAGTPLGGDVLLLRSFSGTEGMSRLFQFQLDFLSEDGAIDFDSIIGQNVTVRIDLADGISERFLNGYVSRFLQLPDEQRLAHYQAEMVPWLWFLSRASDCRIFQQKTVPEVIEQVFKDFGFNDFENQLQKTYDPWEYCVQYRETALDFVMRLMEQEGIAFFFRHEDGKHVLVMADSASTYKPSPHQAAARYEHVTGPGYGRPQDVVFRWRCQQEMRPGRYAITDYNFETPATSLLSSVDSTVDQGGNHRFELFDYPGGYEKRGEGEALVKLRIEEQEAPHIVISGDSNCRAFSSGQRFELMEHDRPDQNGEYLLTSVTHSAHSGRFYSGGEEEGATYENSFTCIPYAVPFRPPQVTPRPVVQGPQTAVVVGPKGEEIHVDKYGRVKVQFHWDRRGTHDEKSSCWVRVSQPWAGKNWGGIWLPRIGQEVVVEFLEGDADRPLITGGVYNANQMPPYELPANQTQSGIKSHSSKGGATANSNELRFEDKKGSEEIFVHAEKDFNTIVENDESILVKKGNRTADVSKGDETITVAQGDRNVNVPIGTYTVKARKIVFEATEEFSLKCSLGTMKINPGGIVSLNSPLVKVNS